MNTMGLIPVRKSVTDYEGIYNVIIDGKYAPQLTFSDWVFNAKGHVVRRTTNWGVKKTIFMHAVIMGLQNSMTGERKLFKFPKVIHKNGDKLDMREENLQALSSSGIMEAKGKIKKLPQSKYKHVTQKKGKWVVSIKTNNKKAYVGMFENEYFASLVADAFVRITRGDHAYINHVEEFNADASAIALKKWTEIKKSI